MADTEPAWWEGHGYLAGRQIDDRHWLCMTPMIFTWRVMLCDKVSVLDFACYHTALEAMDAFEAWDGQGEPPGDWIRHHATGKRRLEDGSIVVAP